MSNSLESQLTGVCYLLSLHYIITTLGRSAAIPRLKSSVEIPAIVNLEIVGVNKLGDLLVR